MHVRIGFAVPIVRKVPHENQASLRNEGGAPGLFRDIFSLTHCCRRYDVEIRSGYDIAFQCFQDTPMTLMLSIERARENDLLSEHRIQFSPDIPSRSYVDMFGNTCTRMIAPPGLIEIRNDFLISDSGRPDEVAPDARQF